MKQEDFDKLNFKSGDYFYIRGKNSITSNTTHDYLAEFSHRERHKIWVKNNKCIYNNYCASSDKLEYLIDVESIAEIYPITKEQYLNNDKTMKPKSENIVKVNIDGKEYKLDFVAAQSKGLLLKEVPPPIRSGDIYQSKSGGTKVLLIKDSANKWRYYGNNGKPFDTYSDTPRTTQEVEVYLGIDSGWHFVKNIEAEVSKLF